MIEIPMTNYLREFFKEQGVVFTDVQTASILWENRMVSRAARLEMLRELAETTRDSALRERLGRYLGELEAAERQFRDNEGGRYIYELEFAENNVYHGWEKEFFSTWENAWEQGRTDKAGRGFKLERRPLDHRDNAPVYGDYDENGVLERLVGRLPDLGMWDREDADAFVPCFVPMPNPFRRGDLVKFGNSLGVVETTPEQWSEILREETDEVVPGVDISLLGPGGRIYPREASLLALEPAECWDDPEEWDLMCHAGELLREEASLDFFLMQYEKNKKRCQRRALEERNTFLSGNAKGGDRG